MSESAALVEYLERCYAAAEFLYLGDTYDGVQSRRALREFSEYLPAARQVAERLAPDLVGGLTDVPSEAFEALGQLIGVVRHREAIEQLLPPVGPALRASGFHERVWDAAKHRWDDDRPLDAIRAAAAEVEQQLRAKVGNHDEDASSLVGRLFSPSPAAPGQPRLRLGGIEGSRDWRNVHEGAAAFGRGVFMAIRNPHAHRNTEPPQQEALEYLAALSVLARWIERASIEDPGASRSG